MAAVPPLRKMPDYRNSYQWGGQSKMTAWLPNGAKWTGAQLETLGYDPKRYGPSKKTRARAAKPPKPELAAITQVDQFLARIHDLEQQIDRHRQTLESLGGTLTSDEFKAARHTAGLTQVQVAELLRVNHSTVWRWEHGATIPYLVAERITQLATTERSQS